MSLSVEQIEAAAAGYGYITGRVPVDLGSGNVYQVEIPKDSEGCMVTWIPDNTTNVNTFGNAGGSVKIYLGETGMAAWAFMGAPNLVTSHMNMISGPLAKVWQRGTYLTIMGFPNAQSVLAGILLFEFTAGSLKRSSSTA